MKRILAYLQMNQRRVAVNDPSLHSLPGARFFKATPHSVNASGPVMSLRQRLQNKEPSKVLAETISSAS